MSLQNPRVRREFLARVFSVVPEAYRKLVSPDIVETFVDIVSTRGKDPFPIDGDDVCQWMGLRNFQSLTRLVVPWLAKKNRKRKSPFVEGRDFILIHMKPNRYKLMLSVNAFEQLCAMQNNPVSFSIQQYLFAVERLYRDHAERIIYERQQTESGEEIEKNSQIDSYKLDTGELAYLDEIIQKDPETGEEKVFLHPGHTLDEPARKQNLKNEFGHRQKMIRKAYGPGATAIEEEFKRLARRWKLKCVSSPKKNEVFYSRNLPAGAIWQASVKAQEFADAYLQKLLEKDGNNDPILNFIPKEQQSDVNDAFTFGTKHKNIKTVRKGRTERIIPKELAADLDF